MSNIIPFNFNDRNVRVVQDDNNQPWFVLTDVCRILGIKNATDVAKRLDKDELTRFNLGGQSGETNIINEYGLYAVVLRSDKPEAKKFQKWITSEVLPSIRKTGGYQRQPVQEEVDTKSLLEANRLFKSNLSIAKAIFKGNQAVLSANMATRKATNVDVLDNIGATHLLADSHEALLTPSDIGKQIGLSAQKTNILLEEKGLVISFRDHKNKKQYELTASGEKVAETLDTSRKHSDGAPVKQIKWRSGVVDMLKTS